MAGTPNNPIDWVYCAALGLGGGLIQNIVNPSQRGFGGFVSSAAVGTFCGFLGGVVANECEWSSGVQWLCSGAAGVFGFAVLQGVFSFLNSRKSGQNFHILGGTTHIGNRFGDHAVSESGATNINVSGQGCQQNINSTIHGQTMNNTFGDNLTREQVYSVIVDAIPESDTEARAAARQLMELESEADQVEDTEQVRAQQSVLGKYKDAIIAALTEMGLAWLERAYPQVTLVKPLIRFAMTSLTKGGN